MNENPYSLDLKDIAVVGTFDVMSLRKNSAIKSALMKYAQEGAVHIAVIADMLAYKYQETVPLQEEERRAKNVFLITGLKPFLIMGENALMQYIKEKQPYCRFIMLSSESKEMKDYLKRLLEESNCVFSVQDAFQSDNSKFQRFLEKKEGVKYAKEKSVA